MSLRVLLTGHDGFTGRHLGRALEGRGHVVLPLEADLTQAHEVHRAVADARPQAVIHLAALSYVPDGEGERVYAVNTVGTDNLLRALADMRPPPTRIILASSSQVYGLAGGMIGEDAALAPVNHYGASKAAMEFMARAREGLAISIVRPFNYTGRGQEPRFLVPKLVQAFGRRERLIELGNIDIERDISDVRWIVACYLALIEAEAPKAVYNLCSGRSVSIRELIATLRRLTGHEIEIAVNADLVRATDIRRQVGDPTRIGQIVRTPPPPIEATLAWMLEAGDEPS